MMNGFIKGAVAAVMFGLSPVVSAEPLKVVASIEPLALLARDIGGEQVSVMRLLPKNSNPHQFQLKPSARRALLEADLLLWIGPDLETALVKVAATLPQKKQLPWLAEKAPRTETHHHSHHAHHEEEHKSAHPWIDVERVSQYAKQLRQRLAERLPKSAEGFRERESQFQRQLLLLDQQTQAVFKMQEKAEIIVDHDGYDGFLKHYGVTQLGSIRGKGHGSVSAKHLGALYRLKPMAVVTSELNDALAAKLATNKGVPLVSVDLLASDKAYSSFLSYFLAFSQNFTVISPVK